MNDLKIYIKDKNPYLYHYLLNGKRSNQYDQIIDIINKHEQYNFVTDKDLYHMVMYELQKTTDMKIKLSNGDVIYVFQPIIKTIPYFNLLLKDAYDDSWSRYREIYVDFDPFVIKEIINSLYTKMNLNFSNIIPIMMLMDKLLYDQPIKQVISFLQKNIDMIIHIQLQDENIENLIMMETILYNMIYTKSDEYDNGIIYDLIKKFNVCEKYIFSFTHWFDIFDQQQQYNNIVKYQLYTLFNQSTIEPEIIMKFLITTFPESHCFYNIVDRYTNFSPPCIYYKQINENPGHHYITFIKNYYPIFSYILLDPVLENITYVGVNTFKIKIYKSYKHMTVGSTLIIGDLKDIQTDYTIVEINKCINDQKFKTNHLIYTSILEIEYEITLNKNLPIEADQKIWLQREFNINVN